MQNKLTQERLREVLHYNPETGLFAYKIAHKIRGRKGWEANDIAGYVAKDGYIICNVDNKNYLAHRLAFLYMEGYFPENMVDHIDRQKTNNKWNNLREVSASCNARNCKVKVKSKSGITGVWKDEKKNKWVASIGVNAKPIYLGYFEELSDAVKARWEAEKKYGYPNCNTTSSAFVYLKRYGYL